VSTVAVEKIKTGAEIREWVQVLDHTFNIWVFKESKKEEGHRNFSFQ
jgi:hypothetical protein